MPSVFPFAHERHEFPNGLQLLTIPTDSPQVVSLFIVVRVGSRNEVEPGRSGFAHLFEHMMFRGTTNTSPEQYEQSMKQIGAASNAYTADDLTAYHTTFSKEDLDLVLSLEADRFRHLNYSPDVFRTETLAVRGEYSKDSTDPAMQLFETLRDTAFDVHPYKHTTMGFLRDIEQMPTLFDYSRLFYERFYRPEHTTVILCGDITPAEAQQAVERHWGGWQRGSYMATVPPEPAPSGPREGKVNWHSPTPPWVTVAFRGAAFSDRQPAAAALDLLLYLNFSSSSDLYRQLVLEEQTTDVLYADNADHVDPYLFNVSARVQSTAELPAVRDAILAAFETSATQPVAEERLEGAKRHLRYAFAHSLDHSEAIAGTVARYVSLGGGPETVNRIYDLYDALTPADLQRTAQRYFQEQTRTIVTLTGPDGNA